MVGGKNFDCRTIHTRQTNIVLSEREQWLSQLLLIDGGYQWKRPLFKMDLKVDGEIRIFNEKCNDSRRMTGTARGKVKRESLERVIFTRCYFVGSENSYET